MRKVKLEVLEKLTYRRDITVNLPGDMGDDDLEEALDKAQREEFLDDFIGVLREHGITVGQYDKDLSSPWDNEVECVCYEELEEG